MAALSPQLGSMVREYSVRRRGGGAGKERTSFASSWEVYTQHNWKLLAWSWLQHLCSAGGVVQCITKGSYFEFHPSLVHGQSQHANFLLKFILIHRQESQQKRCRLQRLLTRNRQSGICNLVTKKSLQDKGKGYHLETQKQQCFAIKSLTVALGLGSKS